MPAQRHLARINHSREWRHTCYSPAFDPRCQTASQPSTSDAQQSELRSSQGAQEFLNQEIQP